MAFLDGDPLETAAGSVSLRDGNHAGKHNELRSALGEVRDWIDGAPDTYSPLTAINADDPTYGGLTADGGGAGGTDNATALQAAADAARDADKTLLIPPGHYFINSTLTFQCSVQAPGVTLFVGTGATVGIQLGVTGTTMLHETLLLPEVRRADAASGTGTGVKLVDCDANIITLPYVHDFADGINLAGDGASGGVSYNTIIVGQITSAERNFVAEPTNNGWSSQNLTLGGRWTFSVTGTQVAGTRQVQIGTATSMTGLGNIVFVGCSFEGEVPEFHVESYGKYGAFRDCRWEAPSSGGARVKWADDGTGTTYAHDNIIEGGHLVEDIVVTHGEFTRRNHVITAESRDRANVVPTTSRATVFDTFERGDSTASPGVSPSDHTWSNANASVCGIASGRWYVVTLSGGAAMATVDSGLSNGFVKASWSDRTGDCGVTFRGNDDDNFLMAEVRDTNIRLLKQEAAVNSVLATGALTGISGAPYDIEVVVLGAEISVLINGVERIAHTLAGGDETTFASGTRVGLRATSTTARAAEFSVR